MQSVKIDIHISDLLYSYDCVVIPDFGGFVTNYSGAKIQAIQHKIAPPSKQITFNKNLKTNDGLLSNHIAERRAISYDDANELIKSFVNQSIEGLSNGDKIKIEKIGTLYLDPERNIQFLAEEKNDYLLDSFGLGTLRVQPIKREGAEERIEKKIKKVVPLIQEEEKKKRKYYWPAAALIVFFLVSSLMLNKQFNILDSSTINYSKFGWNSSEEGIYTSRDATTYTDIAVEEALSMPELAEGIVPYVVSETEGTKLFIDNRSEESKSRIDNTAVAEGNITKNLRFHVMGGCFSSLSNAEGLVEKLIEEGFDARLLGTYKNLYAVSFGSFASRKEATELLSLVKSDENSAAWLLIKPF